MFDFKRVIGATVILAVMSVMVGCEPEYDGLVFNLESSPPAEVKAKTHRIEIPSGIAAVYTVGISTDSAAEFDDSTELELVSEDESVIQVRRGQTDREFVIVGIWSGETGIVVIIDGKTVDTIQATCLSNQ